MDVATPTDAPSYRVAIVRGRQRDDAGPAKAAGAGGGSAAASDSGSEKLTLRDWRLPCANAACDEDSDSSDDMPPLLPCGEAPAAAALPAPLPTVAVLAGSTAAAFTQRSSCIAGSCPRPRLTRAGTDGQDRAAAPTAPAAGAQPATLGPAWSISGESASQPGSSEADPCPDAAPARVSAVPPAIQMLEHGYGQMAEGIVFSNHLRRGLELESERFDAKQSFHAAQGLEVQEKPAWLQLSPEAPPAGDGPLVAESRVWWATGRSPAAEPPGDATLTAGAPAAPQCAAEATTHAGRLDGAEVTQPQDTPAASAGHALPPAAVSPAGIGAPPGLASPPYKAAPTAPRAGAVGSPAALPKLAVKAPPGPKTPAATPAPWPAPTHAAPDRLIPAIVEGVFTHVPASSPAGQAALAAPPMVRAVVNREPLAGFKAAPVLPPRRNTPTKRFAVTGLDAPATHAAPVDAAQDATAPAKLTLAQGGTGDRGAQTYGLTGAGCSIRWNASNFAPTPAATQPAAQDAIADAAVPPPGPPPLPASLSAGVQQGVYAPPPPPQQNAPSGVQLPPARTPPAVPPPQPQQPHAAGGVGTQATPQTIPADGLDFDPTNPWLGLQ